jgi:hypothetical protein
MKIHWKVLWQAFRNLLIVIGGIAIPAYLANCSAWAIAFSIAWLGLILAVLYGIEIGRRDAWKNRWDERPEAFGPRVK